MALPTTGVISLKVHEIRVDYEVVNETVQGERFSIPVDQTIRRSDKLYKWSDIDDMSGS